MNKTCQRWYCETNVFHDLTSYASTPARICSLYVDRFFQTDRLHEFLSQTSSNKATPKKAGASLVRSPSPSLSAHARAEQVSNPAGLLRGVEDTLANAFREPDWAARTAPFKWSSVQGGPTLTKLFLARPSSLALFAETSLPNRRLARPCPLPWLRGSVRFHRCPVTDRKGVQ